MLLAMLGCGDDGTGPGSFDVNGTWSASWSNMAGGGALCSSTSGTQLSLNQTGSTFSGSFNGGEVSCTGPGGPASMTVGSGLVTDGTLNGRNVGFDLGTSEFHQTGTVTTATTMTGTAEWSIDFGIPVGVVTLSGNWSATKQ